MARRTDGEKIDELQQLVAALTTRLDVAVKEIDAVYDAQSAITQSVNDLRRDVEKTILLLNREIADLKKWNDERKTEQDERARRWWAFGPNIVAAFLSGIIAFLVAYFVPRR
jgi:hypothetical protein